MRMSTKITINGWNLETADNADLVNGLFKNN